MLLFLAFLFCLSWCVPAKKIIVSEQGSNSKSCFNEHSSVSCKSLVAVADYLTNQQFNNAVIRIKGSHYTLQGVAYFKGMDNVTITGEQTHIICNGTNNSGAGIAFEQSSNISLKNFTLTECGAPVSCDEQKFAGYVNVTAIQIIDCSRVNVSGIVISTSVGQGLTFINTASTVRVIDSHFINNTIINGCGGGLQILFFNTDWTHINTNYTLSNNVFMKNKAGLRITQKFEVFNSFLCERGGGVRIIFYNIVLNNESSNKNINITLENNTIQSNYAVFGGGMFVFMKGITNHTSVHLLTNRFITNSAFANGGGLNVGVTATNESTYPRHNTIFVFNSSFVENKALFGGGLSFFTGFTSFHNPNGNNALHFEDCNFEGNVAHCGSAVNIDPDIFRHTGKMYICRIYFTNCAVKNNLVLINVTNSDASEGNGAFFVSDVEVSFTGIITFTGNNGTALYLDSTDAIFHQNSTVHFSYNSGYQGGAVLLFGNSNIYVSDYVYFHFLKNSATKLGGAICALNGGQRVFSYLNSCFLRISTTTPVSIYFYFFNNSAKVGNDIFATSIAACNALCEYQNKSSIQSNTPKNFFNSTCYGNFTFDTINSTKYVSTSPINVTVNDHESNSSIIPIIPGIPINLDILQHDELGNNVGEMFPLTAKVLNSVRKNAEVESAYSYITNNTIVVLGNQGDKGELLLESQTVRHIVSFKLSDCPPGFATKDENDRKCGCSNDYNSLKCGPNETVLVTVNKWVGYENISNTSQYNLFTGHCIAQLCNYQEHIRSNKCNKDLECPLPKSPDMLQEVICGKDRQGILCGRCVPNKYVYYHSYNYTCGNSSCQYGIPLYFALELLPVTIIFLTILLFNIRLTSGALYSFVFYVQALSESSITAFGTIYIDDIITKKALTILEVLIGIFNFNMINFEFCIIQTDSLMILFLIKYATLAYAFFLVLATILVLRLHSCYSCVKLCRKCGRRNIRGSVVDGLSAFLMLCYFQCAVVTSKILTYSYIFGIENKWYKTVPLFDGELEYFKGEHLFSAVPAIICLVIILIPPPSVLLLEPLLTKLFNMDCFTRTYIKFMYNRLRLKLMPFLDSFQACFEDNKRYFAGLYFIYRLFIPLAGVIWQSQPHYFGAVVCFFFVILLLHAILQPYKKKWHSLLELSFLINLTLLFTITEYNYAYSKNNGKDLVRVQLLLIFLSFAYIVFVTAQKINQKFFILSWCLRKTKRANMEVREVSTDFESFPFRLQNDDITNSNIYNTF